MDEKNRPGRFDRAMKRLPQEKIVVERPPESESDREDGHGRQGRAGLPAENVRGELFIVGAQNKASSIITGTRRTGRIARQPFHGA